jgi:hypothetical protein
MEEREFAALSTAVGQAESRRTTLTVVVAGLGSALLGMVPRRAAAQLGDESFGFCHLPGKNCTDPQQCCAGRCTKGKCGCNPRGRPCFSRVGIVCCSQRCRKGKCL